MNDHRFILEPYTGMKSRYHCPGCNSRQKTFALYIDAETGNPIADYVGRCNREDKCGYHYTPKQYFQDNNISSFDTKNSVSRFHALRTRKQETAKTSFIEPSIFKASLKAYDQNNFVKFLCFRFGNDVAKQLIEKYFIGTSKHWPGASIFWQIDEAGKIRTGKIMLYNPITGKRVKEPYNHIQWVHKALKLPEFSLNQCLYGLPLLKENNIKPKAIFESEKSAIIASIYFPEFICMATGSKGNLTAKMIEPLKGKNIILFPDLGAFEAWSQKAIEIEKELPGTTFKISDLLERKATAQEKAEGLDIADFLLRFDTLEFQNIHKPKFPQWYLLHAEALKKRMRKEITNNQYCNQMETIAKDAGLSVADYVSQVRKYDPLYFKNN